MCRLMFVHTYLHKSIKKLSKDIHVDNSAFLHLFVEWIFYSVMQIHFKPFSGTDHQFLNKWNLLLILQTQWAFLDILWFLKGLYLDIMFFCK